MYSNNVAGDTILYKGSFIRGFFFYAIL